MTEKSKPITGLNKDELITNSGKYFSEVDKRAIIEEYLSNDSSKLSIWMKYTGQAQEGGQLLKWMRQLGYSDKPKKYETNIFSIDKKHAIIQDYLLNNKSKQDIWYKYTGQYTESGRILKWMRKLGYEEKDKKRNTTFVANVSQTSKSKQMQKSTQNANNKALQDKIARLEKELEEAKIKAIAYSTMIDIAEQELNIPIRKKQNTKPLKK
jgi:hypothetical protein